MYRVIVKYPVCAYVVTYYNVQSIKTPLHSEFWCGAASHYYTTRQSPSHYLTSGQIIRWLVMIGHQMLMEFLDLFLKRPLPIICTYIVLFLEIDIIPIIPEFFSLIFSLCRHRPGHSVARNEKKNWGFLYSKNMAYFEAFRRSFHQA